MNLRRRGRSTPGLTPAPRIIVKRSRMYVGDERPRSERTDRRIVRRTQGAGVLPMPAPSRRRRWYRPSIPRPRRPGWRFYTATTLVLVLGGGGVGGYWAWQTPYFQVSEIQVEGNALVSTEALIANSGLLGERMMTVDLKAAQAALYELPLVASARIERKWPHGIRIVIEERQAWGTWEQGGVPYTIDREGVVLGTMAAPEGSPVIRSSQQGSRQQGDRVDYQAVDAAAAIYIGLPQTLGAAVAEIAYVPEKGLQVTTADGETAIFGDSSSIEYKLAVWAAMATRARADHITYTTIDLRFGNRPVLQ